MKISLALGPRKPLDREQARACLVANICFPGSGTLLAGRRIGYAQLLLVGVAYFLQFIFLGWYVKLWFKTRQFPFPAEWAFGIPRQAVFMMAIALTSVAAIVAAWLWALLTSLIIASEVKRGATKQTEPQAGKTKPPALKVP